MIPPPRVVRASTQICLRLHHHRSFFHLASRHLVHTPVSRDNDGYTVRGHLTRLAGCHTAHQASAPKLAVHHFVRFDLSALGYMEGNQAVGRMDKGKGKLRSSDMEVAEWEGNTVFVQHRPSLASRLRTPTKTISAGGSSSSPISIYSSSPSPPATKRRPRAVPAYTSNLPRTAFTPPRPLAYSTSALGSPHAEVKIGTFEFRTSPSPSPGPAATGKAERRRAGEKKPLHPFFTSRKAPPATQPRYVATYSSTSASASTSASQSTAADSQSTSSSFALPSKGGALVEEDWAVEEVETVESSVSSAELDEVLGVFKNIDLNKTSTSSSARPVVAQRKAVIPSHPPAPTLAEAKPTRWSNLPTLPPFSYRTYPNPPRFAFTSSSTEANDLLACLKGPVLGFDLEWPMTGVHKVTGEDGKVRREKHGMTWNAAKGGYVMGQAKTALVQVCDERMIVLIQLKGMKELPSRLVEMLQDPEIYLAGVQSNGDGLKISRDFPAQFASAAPSSLLELSRLARITDPDGTAGHRAPLISLANLCKGYLGRELDKDPDVRKGNWGAGLTFKQLEYAANDVYASLQLYLHFKRLAAEKNITLDLASSSSCIMAGTTGMVSVAPPKASGSVERAPMSGFPAGLLEKPKNGAGPAAFRALSQFQDGQTLEGIAKAGGIKLNTVHYVFKAIEALPPDHLSADQKARAEEEIPIEAFWGGPLRKLFRRHSKQSSAVSEVKEKVEELPPVS